MNRGMPTRCRPDSDILIKWHGVESDGPDTYVSVFETADGKADALSYCDIHLMRQRYKESRNTPGLSPASLRAARLAEEDRLLNEALGLMNDLRTSRAFCAAALSFPPAIEKAAETVWTNITRIPLHHPLKP